MGGDNEALKLFHPLIRGWFEARFGRPTQVQAQAWPGIAAGEHLLAVAPTGSGKTLAAFLWSLDRLLSGAWPPGRTSVLYISPLKALNNDVQRNLLSPLAELRQVFEAAGEEPAPVRVETRSGDTPQAERRRMVRRPPEILITTPESLHLLLSSQGGRSILPTVRTVILDEIHAVVGSKRGTLLMTAVDRLVRLAGEFQRVALSATVRPLKEVARFAAGYRLEGSPEAPGYLPREIRLVHPRAVKEYDLKVRFPLGALPEATKESVWEPLAEEFKEIIGRNRSTLLFANSRRLTEKLTLRINSREERPLAYAHHGSLSREMRSEVEAKLKAGELRAIVATNSLELGIDIGTLDEVVLVQSPPSVSSAVQRVGRAGHQVGEVSRAELFPTHALDIIQSAVLARAIKEGEIEPIRPVEGALDVLAQVIVSMVGLESWDLDELFGRLKTSHPFRHLTRREFDLVLNMLGGRYAASRIRELRPRISIDRLENTVRARKGALLALYTSGGVIPDRGYFKLRHFETNGLIGELDEEFVWEASLGQTFNLGTQNWRIERITHNDVLVRPAAPDVPATPFWRAEENGRGFHLSELMGRFLEGAEARLKEPGFKEELSADYCLEEAAAREVIDFLLAQAEATGRELPHCRHLVVEHVAAGPGGTPGHQVLIHTFWGGRVNRPLAVALGAAWEERFGQRLEIFAGNDSVSLILPHPVEGAELLSLVTPANLEELLRRSLAGSGFFGARFREAAGRALLLVRPRFGQRLPLWMSRLKSQKLLAAVENYGDFPILLEAWRTCLKDELDLEGLRRLLAGLETGEISWSEARTAQPSPMARSMTFSQVSKYMYMTDEPPGGGRAGLKPDLLEEVVFSPGLRPVIDPEIAAGFEAKRQRLAPGYAPASVPEVWDWVKERLLIPEAEWGELAAAVERDHGLARTALEEELAARLVRLYPGPGVELVAALEETPRLVLALGSRVRVEPLGGGGPMDLSGARPAEEDEGEEEDEALGWLLTEWLQFYGPLTADKLARTLGLGPGRLALALQDLAEERRIVQGRLTAGGTEEELCEAGNLEILLRLSRARARPAFQALEARLLPLFLAHFQGLTGPGEGQEDLGRVLEGLLCLPARAGLWEEEILPARLSPFRPAWLDRIIQEGELRWLGTSREKVAFCFRAELDLLGREEGDHEGSPEAGPDVGELFPDPDGRYDFSTLLRTSGLSSPELAGRLWSALWKGEVANDSFLALRRGIETGFKVPLTPAGPGTGRRGRSGGRAGFGRWKTALPMAGSWFRLPELRPPEDLIEAEERNKDRVRVLLDRYGLLFRELLQKEAEPFRWPAVFRTLRLMELSGEVLAGAFFQGIPGLQFISHRAFRVLQRALPERAVYWLNAADPASVCGLGLEPFRDRLPRRLESSHLVFRGTEPVLVSERRGAALTFLTGPEDPEIQSFLSPLHHLLQRGFQNLKQIKVETINGEKAAFSPFLEVLRTGFEVSPGAGDVVLYRRQG